MKAEYTDYMIKENLDGSNKASSYLRALELLQPILARKGGAFKDCGNIYEVRSVERIAKLYEFILEQQRLGERGIFGNEKPSSYWRNRYYSAAISSYRKFLVLYPFQQRLWELYIQEDVQPSELARQLEEEKLENHEVLFSETEFEFSTKSGKETLIYVKNRINQGFFRKMILHDYSSQCCITGLNLVEILRASHIVSWASDKQNRMNPANGICLSATYDAAFDRHLISFDEDFRMIINPILKNHYTNEAFKKWFLDFKGKRIIMPKRFSPDQSFLAAHREGFSALS